MFKRHLTVVCSGLLLSACASQDLLRNVSTATIQGEVYYLQRIALPEGAVLSVTLQDISRADAPSIELARDERMINQQVPLPFQLTYSTDNLATNHSSSVRARISHQDKLLFTSTQAYLVQPQQPEPTPLRIRVDPIQ